MAARIDLAKLSPDWTLASRGIAQQTRLNRLPHPPHALFAGGATLGFRREVFEAAGDFDPAFAVMEDIDFCVRAHLAGFELVFVPEAVYHYRFRGDLAGIWRQAYRYNYYRALLRRRYGAEPLADPPPLDAALRPRAEARAAAGEGRARGRARRRPAEPRAPGRRLTQASGQLWGQLRGALAFRVAPPRQQAGRKAVAAEVPGDIPGDPVDFTADFPGDTSGGMALTPRT